MNNVAQTILEQLGGNRFVAMTGARNMSAGENVLYVHLPRGLAAHGINHLTVTLDPSDTYTMTFRKVRGTRFETVAEQSGVYGDQLQAVFTRATGLETSL